jgi:3'(2'), 5'-bisphosphate nucleotidase
MIKEDRLIEAVNAAVRQAGQAIMAVYNSEDFGVEHKQDDSPLTRADRQSHESLVSALAQIDDTPILSEEGAEIPWSERQSWSRYWLIDPLDGTKEFIKRNGEFTVNVALIENGRAVLGAVYAPVLDVLYYASEAQAYKQEGSSEPQQIFVSPIPKADETWRIVGSRSHQSEDFKGFVAKFAASDIVSMGSSLKLCLVAEGQADLYPRLGLTSEWDTAAAQAVVEAAGGQVINWESKETLLYNAKDSLLNPYFIVCAGPDSAWF